MGFELSTQLVTGPTLAVWFSSIPQFLSSVQFLTKLFDVLRFKMVSVHGGFQDSSGRAIFKMAQKWSPVETKPRFVVACRLALRSAKRIITRCDILTFLLYFLRVLLIGEHWKMAKQNASKREESPGGERKGKKKRRKEKRCQHGRHTSTSNFHSLVSMILGALLLLSVSLVF